MLPNYNLGKMPRMLLDQLATKKRRSALLKTPFYQRYQCSNPLSIFEVDLRVFISPELRIFFNGIGKAGHSIVIVKLAKALHGNEVTVGQAKTGSFQRPSTLSADQVNDFDSFFKFTLVRNPLPQRWSGNTRNWQPIEVVMLNPDRTATEIAHKQSAA